MTSDIALQYENRKVVNMQRPWKYYRKMARNMPHETNNQIFTPSNNKGYIDIDQPTATQSTGVVHYIVGDVSNLLGNVVVTWYILFVGRK
jgi:hypothetical protein